MPPPPPDRPAGYRFGTFELDLRAVRLLDNGEPVHLEPRALQILRLLVERRGDLVTKEELLEEVWQGTFVSDSALTRAVARLRHALGDRARQPRYIETAPTLGYRFVAEVEPLSKPASGSPAPVAEGPLRRAGAPRRWRLAAAVATAAALGLVVWAVRRESAPGPELATSTPPALPPRIVVLPFANLGTPEDEYFADGLTEEITSRLAMVPGLRVISRTTAIQYREDPPALSQIARDLTVDYVLEGTVRWAGDPEDPARVRVTPQLIRASDDTNLWSESYDRELRQTLGMQSDIAARVVDRLGIELLERDRAAVEARPTDDPAAYQLYLKVLASVDLTRPLCEWLDENRELLDGAVALDPRFVEAWSALAQLHSLAYSQCPGNKEERALDARQALARAEALAPEAWSVAKARIRVLQRIDRDYPAALRALEAADARVAGDAELLMTRGSLLRRMGRWAEATTDFRRTFELDPRNALAALRIATALTYQRRYGEAHEYFERTFVLAPDYPYPYLWQARNAWLWRGDLPLARRALELYPAETPPMLNWAWFWQQIYEGRIEEALARLERTAGDWVDTNMNTNPKSLLAAQAYELLGDNERARAAYEEALATLETRQTLASPSDRLHRALGLTLAGLGRAEEAIAQGRKATQLNPLASQPYRGSTDQLRLALIYARLGRQDESLELLDQLLAMPSPISVSMLELDPRWTPLRGHPRFEAMRRKYGRARGDGSRWRSGTTSSSPGRM